MGGSLGYNRHTITVLRPGEMACPPCVACARCSATPSRPASPSQPVILWPQPFLLALLAAREQGSRCSSGTNDLD